MTPAVEERVAALVAQHTGIDNCARCDGKHSALDWKRFEQPVEVGANEWYMAWATCPTTGDPIMYSVTFIAETP